MSAILPPPPLASTDRGHAGGRALAARVALPTSGVVVTVEFLHDHGITIRVTASLGVLAGALGLLPGCGDGLIVRVGGDGAADGDADLRDALADDTGSAGDSSGETGDGPLRDDAGLPYVSVVLSPSVTDPACVELVVEDVLDRVLARVCLPPGALSRPSAVTLAQTRSSERPLGPVRELVFRVAAPGTTLAQGDAYRPLVTLHYARSGGLPANLALGQLFPRRGGWEVLKSIAYEPAAGTVSGVLNEAYDRIADGILFAPVLRCRNATDCATNYCSAEVCQ